MKSNRFIFVFAPFFTGVFLRFLVASILLVGIIASSSISHAKAPLDDTLTRKYDPLYIKKYRKYLALTPIMIYRDFTLGFEGGRGEKGSVEYSPNLLPQWGLGVDYNWLSFELTSSWGVNDEEPTKGKTSKLGIAGTLTLPKWNAQGNLQYFKGFYVSNLAELKTTYAAAAAEPIYPHREDMSLITGRGSLYYMFNSKRYSHPSALFVTTERQLKSAGSVLLGVTFTFFSISADSSLIPPSISRYFDSSHFVKKSGYFMLLSNVGYSHTFVFQKTLFLNSGLHFGLGPVYSGIKSDEGGATNRRLDAGATVELRVGLGVNGDRLYGGVLTSVVSTASTAGEESIINNSSYLLRLFVGYRFPIKFVIPILG